MLRRILFCATLAAGCIGLNAPAHAADRTVSLPADTKFVLHLNVQAIRESTVGGKIFAFVKGEIIEKMAEKSGGSGDANIDKLKEIVGFDPFEAIQEVTISASDYESPEKSLVASVRLQQTTGNLEGLLLGLPGYKVEEYGSHQIHSAAPEDDVQFFAAVDADAEGNRTVLLSSQRDAVAALLDNRDGKAGSEGTFKSVALSDEGNPLLTLEVLELPADMIEEGPPANVAKILKGMTLRVGEASDNVNVGLRLTADNDKQAEQLQQMAQGLKAMIDFAQANDPEDEDLKKVQQLVSDSTSTREGSQLNVSLTMPTAEVVKLIEENLNDK